MHIGIAADYGRYELKEQLAMKLRARGFEVEDYRTQCLNASDDYPDFVVPLARNVAARDVERGIVMGGSGVGACVVANKIPCVRADMIHDGYSARQGVEDDNMNVICVGGRVIGPALDWHLVQIFISSRCSGREHHKRRLAKVAQEETKQ